jgi:phage I-like protein
MKMSASGLIGLENEFQVGADGWVRIAPYGESIKERIFRHQDGREEQQTFVQQLDRTAAEEMVRKFTSPWGRLKRFVRGLPIYKRHPDLQDHAPGTVIANALANDKTPCGMFAQLEARDDGFYGKPVVTEAGQLAIENEGLKWLSPFWWVKLAGETSNGTPITRPTELISAGLTDRPNIQGGQALANQREKEHMNKQKLLAALSKVGLALANEATDEQIETAIAGLVPKTVTALENDKTTLTQAKSTAEELLKSERRSARTPRAR